LWLGPNSFVTLTNVNQSGLGLQTKGIDLNGSYSRRLGGIGTLNLAFTGTYLKKLENPHFAVNCAGLYADVCGTPNPKWRHVARATLTMPNGIGASVRWRYFSGVDAAPGQNAVGADVHVKAESYFDLTLTARMQQRLNLRLGVNNVFDKEPPIVGAPAANGNTFPQVYDALGRYIYAGFTVDF
jgi:iron complex outermembrane receptor protein